MRNVNNSTASNCAIAALSIAGVRLCSAIVLLPSEGSTVTRRQKTIKSGTTGIKIITTRIAARSYGATYGTTASG